MQRILIIHYHLNPGGVTRIINLQARSLIEHSNSYEVLLMTGAGDSTGIFINSGIRMLVNEVLNYLPENEQIYQSTYDVLKKFLYEQVYADDIIHVHNLNLGKNPILTLVISELANEGFRIINHVHDFAEDRPENIEFLNHVIGGFFKKDIQSLLYPNLPNFLYAVLTSHDLNRLQELGIDKNNLFLLPNPVAFDRRGNMVKKEIVKKQVCDTLQIDYQKKLVTYPVRAIRRKNMGEYILFAVLFRDEANWLVTQPPLNPVEVESYLQWKSFCLKNKIPVIFEAANLVAFEDIMQASDFCFTTSIQEGFGMTFLEPWLLDTPVLGRNISHVTSDIEKTGVEFPLLYNAFIVNFENKTIDFSKLTPDQQRLYIETIIQNKSLQKELFNDNPYVGKLLTSINESLIKKNKAIILNEFSLKKYAERLERIYQKIT